MNQQRWWMNGTPPEYVSKLKNKAPAWSDQILLDRARVSRVSIFKRWKNKVPHNWWSQKIEGDATTHIFLIIPVHKGDELPEFDHSNVDVIFFD